MVQIVAQLGKERKSQLKTITSFRLPFFGNDAISKAGEWNGLGLFFCPWAHSDHFPDVKKMIALLVAELKSAQIWRDLFLSF